MALTLPFRRGRDPHRPLLSILCYSNLSKWPWLYSVASGSPCVGILTCSIFSFWTCLSFVCPGSGQTSLPVLLLFCPLWVAPAPALPAAFCRCGTPLGPLHPGLPPCILPFLPKPTLLPPSSYACLPAESGSLPFLCFVAPSILLCCGLRPLASTCHTTHSSGAHLSRLCCLLIRDLMTPCSSGTGAKTPTTTTTYPSKVGRGGFFSMPSPTPPATLP